MEVEDKEKQVESTITEKVVKIKIGHTLEPDQRALEINLGHKLLAAVS